MKSNVDFASKTVEQPVSKDIQSFICSEILTPFYNLLKSNRILIKNHASCGFNLRLTQIMPPTLRNAKKN